MKRIVTVAVRHRTPIAVGLQVADASRFVSPVVHAACVRRGCEVDADVPFRLGHE